MTSRVGSKSSFSDLVGGMIWQFTIGQGLYVMTKQGEALKSINDCDSDRTTYNC